MSVEMALSHLKATFPDRMVLTPKELALVLGRSEKAIRHLIERKRLPFSAKKIGGSVVVDMFQVADWLGNVTAEPLELPQVEPKGSASSDSPKSSKGRKARRSSISASLMDARYGLSRVLGEFSAAASSPDDSQFASELGIALIGADYVCPKEFAVTVRSWGPLDTDIRKATQRVTFVNPVNAASFAKDEMSRLPTRFHEGLAGATVSIRYHDYYVFRAYWLPCKDWTISIDNLARFH